MADALKRHERVNAFNLVCEDFLLLAVKTIIVYFLSIHSWASTATMQINWQIFFKMLWYVCWNILKLMPLHYVTQIRSIFISLCSSNIQIWPAKLLRVFVNLSVSFLQIRTCFQNSPCEILHFLPWNRLVAKCQQSTSIQTAGKGNSYLLVFTISRIF